MAAHMTTNRSNSSLSAQLNVSRGAFTLDLALDAAPGEVIALLGPNGAGKTTALRALAGLAPLDGGHINVGDQTLEDPARRIRIAPEDRPIGMVFQSYLLFEHLSALDNVAFGLRARGVRKRAARLQAAPWLERLGMAEHSAKRPGALSGGQSQRVALARAMATDPLLLLLDEPMAALDATTRAATRSELARQLGRFGGVTVLVTHDPLDALALAHRVAVIEDGLLVQTGTPREIARYPKTSYVAKLVGLNLINGISDGSAITLDDGGMLTASEPGLGAVSVAIRPSAITLFREQPHGSARNVWEGCIASIEERTDAVRIAVDGPPDVIADVTPGAVADLDLQLGSSVWCAVKATELAVYPR
jgi:molybdate transport system ATP-binding protein